MRAPLRLGLYGVVVLAAFAGGLGLGAAVGPIDIGGSHGSVDEPGDVGSDGTGTDDTESKHGHDRDTTDE